MTLICGYPYPVCAYVAKGGGASGRSDAMDPHQWTLAKLSNPEIPHLSLLKEQIDRASIEMPILEYYVRLCSGIWNRK